MASAALYYKASLVGKQANTLVHYSVKEDPRHLKTSVPDGGDPLYIVPAFHIRLKVRIHSLSYFIL